MYYSRHDLLPINVVQANFYFGFCFQHSVSRRVCYPLSRVRPKYFAWAGISNWTPFKLGSLNVGIFVHFVKRITLILFRFRLSPNNVKHSPIIIEVRMSLVRLESLSIFLIWVLQCRQPAYNTTLTTNCRRMPFVTRSQSIGDKTAPCWCVSFHTFHCKGSFPFKDYWSVF